MEVVTRIKTEMNLGPSTEEPSCRTPCVTRKSLIDNLLDINKILPCCIKTEGVFVLSPSFITFSNVCIR